MHLLKYEYYKLVMHQQVSFASYDLRMKALYNTMKALNQGKITFDQGENQRI